MKMTLTTYDIANALREDENARWSRAGAFALAEYLEQLEEETGEEMELDTVAIRCDYSEYETAELWAIDYFCDDIFACMGIDLGGEETEEEREGLIRDYIRDHGQLIEFTGGIIVSSF